MRRWYKDAVYVPPPPPPDRITIDFMPVDRVALSRPVPLPVRTIPVEVNPLPVNYSILEKEEVAEAAKRLQLNRTGGGGVVGNVRVAYPPVARGGNAGEGTR